MDLDNFLLIKEKEKEKEISVYNSKIDMIRRSNYSISSSNNNENDKQEIAEIIYKNYSNTDEELMKHLYFKFIDFNKIKSELLAFELKYYKPNKQQMELNEFIKSADYINIQSYIKIIDNYKI